MRCSLLLNIINVPFGQDHHFLEVLRLLPAEREALQPIAFEEFELLVLSLLFLHQIFDKLLSLL